MRFLFAILPLIVFFSLSAQAQWDWDDDDYDGPPPPSTELKCKISRKADKTLNGTCDVTPFPGQEANWASTIVAFKLKGMIVDDESEILVSCSAQTAEELMNTSYLGIRASASAVVSVELGLFINRRGQTCLVSGVKLDPYHIGLGGAKLEFVFRP